MSLSRTRILDRPKTVVKCKILVSTPASFHHLFWGCIKGSLRIEGKHPTKKELLLGPGMRFRGVKCQTMNLYASLIAKMATKSFERNSSRRKRMCSTGMFPLLGVTGYWVLCPLASWLCYSYSTFCLGLNSERGQLLCNLRLLKGSKLPVPVGHCLAFHLKLF
jgi:hypothetical protein